MHILERAIKIGGPTQKAFAKAIGKDSQSYVSMLLYRVVKGGRPIPAEICPKIETATGGRITRFDLRPDVFGKRPSPLKPNQVAA